MSVNDEYAEVYAGYVDSTSDPRMALLEPMLDSLPDGYYAVDPGDDSPIRYWRVSTGKTKRRKGARIFQTQHSEQLVVRAVYWPGSKRWDYYVKAKSLADALIRLIPNHQHFAVLYGQTIGRCCRCNITLTDERSRHYGIGPDCEKLWPWIIEIVNNEQHDGKSYEELHDV